MISKSIGEGFKFAFSVKRVIPYIILDLIAFYVIISFLSSFINMIRLESFNILEFLFSFAILIPAFIIIALVQLWINGAMVDQAKYFPRKRPLTKSFEYSTSRYLTMFCALIIYGIIAWIFSMPRYIGSILIFALTLIFYYLYPVIIVDKKGCLDAFKRSYKTFIRYPLETFVTWLLSVIINLIIVGFFALPLIFLFLSNIVDVFLLMPTTVDATIEPSNFVPGVLATVRSPLFVPYLFILIVALSFTKVFTLGVQTRLYINARKRAL